jgi:hypothetical protein
MTIPQFMEWLGGSAAANAMNGPEWAFPVVESLHFIGFAFLIGTIAIVDLRLLGLGMRRQPAGQLEAELAPWTLAGLAIMLITGPLMFSADAVRYYVNPSFRIKMACLVAAIVFNFTLHRMAARSEKPGAAGILAACVSLALWTSVLGAGRMIAFV